MHTHDRAIRFRDYGEFYDAIAGSGVAAGDGFACCQDAAFASIRSEVYALPWNVRLNLLEIRPAEDIYVPCEFDENHFEVTYCVSGRLIMDDKYHGRSVFQANRLSLTQGFGSRADLILCRDQPFRGIIFNSTIETLSALLGEAGSELWREATRPDDPDRRTDMYMGRIAPSDIMAPFLQISDCDYPSKIKKLFIDSKFREILSRIIAHELPEEEVSPHPGEFETSQIKKIPGILMERIDSPPTILELARELSLNSTVMKMGFKNIFGASIYARHRNLCLERAAMTLLDTGKTVLEIAIESGYSSSVSFCNAFKKRYGISPSQYRQQNKLSGHKVFS